MNVGVSAGEANRRGVMGKRNGWRAWLHNDKRDGGQTDSSAV